MSNEKQKWAQHLSSEQYAVCWNKGTEAPFTGLHLNEKRTGTFVCVCCQSPLFASETKYDSGSGWPSFDREIKGNVAYSVDYKIGIARSEEHCATCGGHLGHVFNDGPRNTTGMRHCINGAALKFIPKNE